MSVASVTSSEDRSVPKPPLPVDRGWAWLIMIGCFINTFLSVAFIRAQSLLLLEFIERFRGPVTMTTLAFGVSEVLESVASLLVPTLLLPRFTVRRIAISGALLFSSAVLGLAFTDNIILVNCLFATVGFARALLLNPQFLLLGYYFRRRLGLANAFAFAGISVATLTAPGVTQYFLDTYGLQGTLMLLAAIFLNCVVASLLLRPVSMYADPPEEEEEDDEKKTSVEEEKELLDEERGEREEEGRVKSEDEGVVVDGEDVRYETQSGDNNVANTARRRTNLATQVKDDGEAAPLLETPNDITAATERTPKDNTIDSDNKITECNGEPKSSPHSNVVESNSTLQQEPQLFSSPNGQTRTNDTEHYKTPSETNTQLRPSSENEEKSIKNTPTNENGMLCERQDVLDNENKSNNGGVKKTPGDKNKKPPSAAASFRSVFSDPMAVLVVLACGVGVHNQGGNTFMAALGEENGVDHQLLPWLLTAAGICDIVFKFLIGYLADRGPLWPIHLAMAAQTTSGVIFQLTWLFYGTGLMFTFAAIFGAAGGCLATLMVPMTVSLSSRDNLPHVMAAFFLMSGGMTFLMQLGVGALKDETGTFKAGYNFIGALMLISVLIMGLRPLIQRRQRRREGRQGEASTPPLL